VYTCIKGHLHTDHCHLAQRFAILPTCAAWPLRLNTKHAPHCCYILQVDAELRKLAQVYAIYSEHTEVVRQYSNMLWSQLDIGSLMESVEGVATKLKKLKGLEDMPVFGLVQAEIAGFADSLPLMKELKSDALR
jgi:hypothetical protein